MKNIFVLLLIYILASINAKAATVDFTANKACKGTYTTLVAITNLHDSLVSAYKWDLNNDGIFTDAYGKTINYLFADADTFKVSLKIVEKTGAENIMTTPKDVIVYPIPDVNFHSDNLCEGKNAMLKSTSSIQYGSLTQYLWDFNNDGNIDNNSGSIVYYNCGTPSTFISKLEVESDKGCRAFTTKTTTVYPQPHASFTAQNACVGNVATFLNNTFISGDNIMFNLWDFGNSNYSTTTGNATYSYENAGNYSTKLIAISSNNCKDTFNLPITVYESPVLNLTFSPDTVIFDGGSVQISADAFYINYNWSTGENSQSISVHSGGDYSLEVADNHGCKASKSIRIFVKGISDVRLKSDILTPNGDGFNDFFMIEDRSAYTKCTLAIYDSWGMEVFTSTDYRNDWNGDNLETGAYYYVIETDKGETKGNINIIRQ
ncbi:MAG: hypothetical protein A2033_18890 [Bacteroidetes bacterium GWA2_31_9]|nr:MAG: hypothetical protein A2033_18890 [Bacteroidetes bacterium GWA2_31_9]